MRIAIPEITLLNDTQGVLVIVPTRGKICFWCGCNQRNESHPDSKYPVTIHLILNNLPYDYAVCQCANAVMFLVPASDRCVGAVSTRVH